MVHSDYNSGDATYDADANDIGIASNLGMEL